VPETATGVEPYCLERMPLAEPDSSKLAEWESFRNCSSLGSPWHDPLWLQRYFVGQLEDLDVHLLYQSGSLCGVAPFMWRKNWPLKWHLGELTIAKPPLIRFRLLGSTLNFPEVESAYDALFSELADLRKPYDALQFESVPLDSFLWKYLHTSPLIRRLFRLYEPDPPAPHHIVRLNHGSMDEYMKKFSSKHRNGLRREVRRIREGALGEMRFVQYRRPEEVSLFLDSAVEVSKKTYQWNLHQGGLRETDSLRQLMLSAAEHGWLRAYLLFCNQVPHAFLLAFQYKGYFMPLETGYDPAFSKYSLGMVLQLMVIEELLADNPPEVMDYGDDSYYKALLATESYLQAKVILFRPTAYTRLVQEGHRTCQAVTRSTARVLDRMHLKSHIKKVIRQWGRR
jgi:hypothetical protein